MNVEIINKPFNLDIYGFPGIAKDKNYTEAVFKLMDKMWQVVKANNLTHNGKNIWVYESNERIFAGVELQKTPEHNTGLEQKKIKLTKYAWYKHIGPYDQLKQAGQYMKTELTNKGFETDLPYIEIYGHWTSNETKLETELLMSLK